MRLHTFCVEELSEADAAVPAGVFDAQGKLCDAYKTGETATGKGTGTGVDTCVLREVLRRQLEDKATEAACLTPISSETG